MVEHRPSAERIREALRHVRAPGSDQDIASCGFVGRIDVTADAAVISLRAGSATPEAVHKMIADIHATLTGFDGLVDVRVELHPVTEGGVV